MAREVSKHSFATQRLLENRFRIICDGKQILKYRFKKYPMWEIPEVKTRIKIGQPLFRGDINRTHTIKDYEDLMHYQVMISKRKPKIYLFKGQKKEYYLTKLSSLKPNIGEIPQDYAVEVNPQTKEFRLNNYVRNFSTEWFNPFPKKYNQYYESKSLFDNTQFNYRNAMKGYYPMKSEEKFSEPIGEIVLGISDDGKLICIQEERENPTIGILGKKRFGKSLIKHRLLDCIYHKWNKKIVELNDVMLETDSYSTTWKPLTKFSNIELINEPSVPLPMVYLHPNTRTLKELVAEKEVGFRTYISFKDFILGHKEILKGRPDLVFNKSGVYFQNLLYDKNGKLDKDGLAFCENYSQQEAVVLKKMAVKGESDEEKQRKIPEGVIPKILEVLKYIDNMKILDTSNNVRAKWTVEFRDGHKEQHYPWTACIIADLVPSIVTHNIKNKHPDIHPQYSNFILKDLFNNQNDNSYFKKNNIELFISLDEILSLVNSPVAVETFDMVIRESGHTRIGFNYCTQSWGELPEFIQSQTDYIISFNQKASWAKEICEDFKALKHRKDELVNLKKGEFIILSSNPVVLYDEYGKRSEVEDEAIKGTIFPSLSAHKAPKVIGA